MKSFETIVIEKFKFRDSDDALVIEYNGLTPEDLTDDVTKYLAGYINNRLHETKQKNVTFFISGEGIPLNPFLFTTAIVRCLVYEYRIPHYAFVIVSGAVPTLSNIEFYKHHIKKYALEQIKISFWNSFENSASQVQLYRNTSTCDPFYSKFDTTPRIKPKLFLSYNRNASRIHRLYLTAEVVSRNLLDRAFFSMYLGGVSNSKPSIAAGELDYVFKHAALFIPESCNRIRQILDDNIDLFPLRLNLCNTPSDTNEQPFHIDNDLHYYNNSYFSVVTETKFFADVDGVYDTQLDCYLFSEKTYKPILGKHPFIYMGMPGSLHVMRDSGYRTFHPYIDETYDTIVNDEYRLEAIIDEIERLSKFTDDQWLEWQTNIQNIVEHNFNVLKEHRPTYLTY